MKVFFLWYGEKAPIANEKTNVLCGEKQVTKRLKLITEKKRSYVLLTKYVGLEFKLFISKICSLGLQNLMTESFNRVGSCFLQN